METRRVSNTNETNNNTPGRAAFLRSFVRYAPRESARRTRVQIWPVASELRPSPPDFPSFYGGRAYENYKGKTCPPTVGVRCLRVFRTVHTCRRNATGALHRRRVAYALSRDTSTRQY